MPKKTGRRIIYDTYIDSDGIKQNRGSSIDLQSLEFRHIAVVMDLLDFNEDEEVRLCLGYANALYDNGYYAEALQRIDWVIKKKPILEPYIFYYKRRCEHVLEIPLTKKELEYKQRFEKYRTLPKWLRWTMSKPQNLIRCKWCGRYIKYIHPDESTFGFDTFANSCNYCGRMYPTPSWLWDSPDGRAYSYYRMSFSDEEFYEEFEQDYDPQPLCQRRQKMHKCPECWNKTKGALSEKGKRLNMCPDCYEGINVPPDWEVKNENEKRVVWSGVYILFVLQNNFFIDVHEKGLANVFEDNIKKYVNNISYQNFISRHKKVKQVFLNKEETLASKIATFSNELIPNEPKIYPIGVGEAQEKYPELLLDIFSLELQYFLSLNVEYIIKNSSSIYKDVGGKFFDQYIFNILDSTGWSTNGIIKAWNYGSMRLDNYMNQLPDDPQMFGMMAGINILNTNDTNVGSCLVNIFYDNYRDFHHKFLDILKAQHGDQGF